MQYAMPAIRVAAMPQLVVQHFIGLDWIGLDWIGLDWIGLDWIMKKMDIIIMDIFFKYLNIVVKKKCFFPPFHMGFWSHTCFGHSALH